MRQQLRATRQREESIMRPLHRHAVPALAVAILLGAIAALGTPRAASSVEVAAQGDFAGLVDIGRRRLYLECRGVGSPTVLLEDGAGAGADLWSVDLIKPDGSRLMVLPTVAGFT